MLEERNMDRLIDQLSHRYDSDDPGHDMAHILRVVNTCQHLGKQLGANLRTLIPAAFLHDVVNVPKDHKDRTRASKMAADEAKLILTDLGYSADELDEIAQIIIEHSHSLGKKASSLESAILQDADRLDAIGAIGLMRMITCGAKIGSTYYDIEDPFAVHRPLNDKRFTIDHLYVKLLKLADSMNTELAKELAVSRAEFLRTFINQLKSEIPK